MTVLGKILVFVNLVFSLLTGALIVMVFVTRTNYYNANAKLVKDLTVERTQYATDMQSMKEAVKAKDAEVQTAVREKEAATTQLQDSQKAFTGVKEREDTYKANIDKLNQNMAALTQEVDRRRDEVKLLSTQVQSRDKKVVDLERTLAAQKDTATQYLIERDASRERNKMLLGQIETLTRDLTRARNPNQSATSPALTRKPPDENVRGQVLAVEGNYVTISLGSDSGLTKNNVLTVYRLQPTPEYLGSLEILETRPNEAVGRFVASSSRPRAKPQKGDEVASEVVPGVHR